MGLLQRIARSQEQLVAVYISATTLAIAVVDEGRRLPRVRVYDFIHLESETGAGSFLDDPQRSGEALMELLRRNGIRNRDAALSIPTHDVIIRKTEMPLMSEEEFQSAAKMGGLWDIFSWMPSPADEYLVDFLSFGRDSSGETMQACMVAAPRQLVQQLVDIAALAGLRTVMVDTHNFSIWRALNRWLRRKERGEIAICEIVKGGDFVTVLEEGIPELTELYGNEQLRHKMVHGLALDVDEVEQLFSAYATQVSGVLRGGGVEPESHSNHHVLLLSDIRNVVEHGEELRQSMASQQLEVGVVNDIFDAPAIVAERFQQEHDQEALLVTLGLGLRRLELFRPEGHLLWGSRVVNLLPNYRSLKRSRKSRFLLHFWSALLGLPLLAATLGVNYDQLEQRQRLQSAVIEVEREERAISQTNQQLERLTTEMVTLQLRLDAAGTMENNHASSFRVLQTLVRQVPLGVQLVRVEKQPGEQWVVQGVAARDEEILEMVERLRGTGRFSRVSLTMIASQSRDGRSFLLECAVIRSPVEPADPTAGERNGH